MRQGLAPERKQFVLSAVSIGVVCAISVFHLFGSHTRADQASTAIESIARDFTALAAAGNGHDLARFAGPKERVVRWEKPVTWTVIGRGGRPPSEYAKLAAMSTFGQLGFPTQSRLAPRFVEPVVPSPTSPYPTSSDLVINRIFSPELNATIDISGRNKGVAIAFRTRDVALRVESDIAILVGDRRILLEFAQQLTEYNVSAPTLAQFTAERCVAFVWAGAGTAGMTASILLVDDQVSVFATRGCMVRPLGRALGLLGEAETGYESAFSLRRDSDVLAWSEFDLASVAMLYDPALRSGMSADEVRMIAPNLVPKYFSRQLRR